MSDHATYTGDKRVADDISRQHLSDGGTWRRLIYMVLFTVIYRVTEVVLFSVVIIQFLFKLFTGSANPQLQVAGQHLGAYIREMVLFLTFATEDRPYPFGPWPDATPNAKGKSTGGGGRRKRPPATQPDSGPKAVSEPPDESEPEAEAA